MLPVARLPTAAGAFPFPFASLHIAEVGSHPSSAPTHQFPSAKEQAISSSSETRPGSAPASTKAEKDMPAPTYPDSEPQPQLRPQIEAVLERGGCTLNLEPREGDPLLRAAAQYYRQQAAAERQGQRYRAQLAAGLVMGVVFLVVVWMVGRWR